MKISVICKECNNEFIADSRELNRGNAKYCSLSCAAKNQRKNSKSFEKYCIICGNIFISKYYYAKYCSNNCKLKNYRNLQKNKTTSISTISRIFKDIPCEICGWNKTTRDMHHIISVKDGGKTSLENIICLCPNCHRLVHKNLISKEVLLDITIKRNNKSN